MRLPRAIGATRSILTRPRLRRETDAPKRWSNWCACSTPKGVSTRRCSFCHAFKRMKVKRDGSSRWRSRLRYKAIVWLKLAIWLSAPSSAARRIHCTTSGWRTLRRLAAIRRARRRPIGRLCSGSRRMYAYGMPYSRISCRLRNRTARGRRWSVGPSRYPWP